jgi:two-component system, OmpR family, sensor histidine kinase KdpD
MCVVIGMRFPPTTRRPSGFALGLGDNPNARADAHWGGYEIVTAWSPERHHAPGARLHDPVWDGEIRHERDSVEGGSCSQAHRTAQGAPNGAGGETRPVRLTLISVSSPFGFLLASEPPPRRVGAIAALAAVALCTLIVYPLAHVAPVVSLSVVYLPAVLVVSVTWGAWLGVATAVTSAAAFNFFHLPPIGRFTLQNSENWVALAAFLVVAILASSVAEVTRARTRDAEERRREADLAAEMARLLLRGNSLVDALPTAAARLAQALEVSSAAIGLDAVDGDERMIAFPLREGTRRLGTLLVGASTSEANLRRLQERVVPALEALLSAALERETLLGGVVETAALRRADTVKTALLRAVSHDLRSPLTAITTAGEAVGSPAISPAEREEMAAVIQEEAKRLSRLVDNLLDLSRLQAGAAEPHREWTSIDELIRAAVADVGAGPEAFSLSIDRDMPLVSVDPVQMERAFVNVLENARRYAGGHPVSVRARAVRRLAGARAGVPAAGRDRERSQADGAIGERARADTASGDRAIVRIVDRGPGIPPAQLERVFEPFYRAGTPASGHRGSGLGLAIARGFTEANAGSLHVESLPGQGATFVFELPLDEQ